MFENPRDVLLAPVISEKSYGLLESGSYTFEVHPDANKTQVKIAIEKIFDGVKVISVTRDITDAYVHAGGQYEWDSAAPVAVARAAGLFTSRVDGTPLEYNRENVSLPDLIVCRPELAEQIVAFVQRHGTD